MCSIVKRLNCLASSETYLDVDIIRTSVHLADSLIEWVHAHAQQCIQPRYSHRSCKHDQGGYAWQPPFHAMKQSNAKRSSVDQVNNSIQRTCSNSCKILRFQLFYVEHICSSVATAYLYRYHILKYICIIGYNVHEEIVSSM